jgi:hypothetical protein
MGCARGTPTTVLGQWLSTAGHVAMGRRESSFFGRKSAREDSILGLVTKFREIGSSSATGTISYVLGPV